MDDHCLFLSALGVVEGGLYCHHRLKRGTVVRRWASSRTTPHRPLVTVRGVGRGCLVDRSLGLLSRDLEALALLALVTDKVKCLLGPCDLVAFASDDQDEIVSVAEKNRALPERQGDKLLHQEVEEGGTQDISLWRAILQFPVSGTVTLEP